MGMKEDVMELKKELEKVKKDGVFMADDEIPIATEVVKMLKTDMKRLYIILICFVFLLLISIADSIYQREQIIEILNDMEVVEETIVETYDDYDVTQESGEGGNNNFINGSGNEVNN